MEVRGICFFLGVLLDGESVMEGFGGYIVVYTSEDLDEVEKAVLVCVMNLI